MCTLCSGYAATPDSQAQSVSAGNLEGCVPLVHEKIEGVSQSGDCATLLYEGDFNENKLRRRVFDPGGLWLRIDCCQGCRVARRHLLSDTKYLGTLFIHSLTTMERGRREEGIVMAWEAI